MAFCGQPASREVESRPLTDPAVASSDTFKFEHTRELSEADYRALQAYSPSGYRLRGRLILGAITLLGFVSLFSLSTLAVGIVLLIAAIIGWSFPRMMRSSARRTYEQYRYLHGPVTYGVSNEGFWLRAAHLDSFSRWPNLAGWREHDDVLNLGASGMMPVYLPVSQLRNAGLYDRVMDLARHHGSEFGVANSRKGRLPQN
jgi:hypothetical protein